MALTMEDILLERQRRRTESSPESGYAEPKIIREEREELEYLRKINAAYTPPSPPEEIQGPPAPTILDRLGQIPSAAIESMGERYLQEAEQGRAQAPGVARAAIGAGEAAATVGSGFAGFGIGVMGATEKQFRRYGAKSFGEILGGVPEPDNPNFWKDYIKSIGDIASEYTYVPRTEEGKAAVAAIAPAFEALHTFSRKASEAPLARMLLTDDQRELLAFGHELVTMTVGGEIATGGIRALGRNRIKEFQKTFVEASKEPQGGPATEKLITLSEELAQKAKISPEISEKFSPERVARLREKQTEQGIAEVDAGIAEMERIRLSERDPNLIPRLKEEGEVVLELLNENPDNIQNIQDAKVFFENSRGFGDEALETIRDRVGDTLQLPEPTPGEGPIKPTTTPTMELKKEGEILIQKLTKNPNYRNYRYDAIKYFDETSGSTDIDVVNIRSRLNEKLHLEQPILSPTPAIRPSRKSRTQPEAVVEEVPLSGEATLGIVEPPTSIAPLENPYKITRTEGAYEVTREGIPPQSFSNAGAANKYAREQWKNEQASPSVRETEATFEDIHRSISREAPSAKSAEEKIQAVEQSNSFANRESTIKRIQDSLESGENISREIFDAIPGAQEAELALLNYTRARLVARKGIDSSNRRGINEMVQDMVELFGFTDEASLSHRQRIATQRLSADTLKGNRGKTVLDYINEMGMSPDKVAMFKDYIDNSMPPIKPPDGSGPKSMPLSGDNMSGNPILERNVKESGLLGPPVDYNSMKTIQEAPTVQINELPSQFYGIEKPRVIVRKFGKDVHEMLFGKNDETLKKINTEKKELGTEIDELRKLISYKESRNITKAQEKGVAANLQGREKQMHDTVGNEIARQFVRADEIRYSIGKEPLNPVDDPVGAMRAIINARSRGVHVNLVTTPADIITQVLQDHWHSPMKRTATQFVTTISPEANIFRQYSIFSSSNIDHFNMAPITATWREIANYSHLDVVKMDGSMHNLQVQNPGLHRFIMDSANVVDGKPVGLGSLVLARKNFDPILQKYGENMTWSMLSGNLRSVQAQPFSLIPTMFKAGTGNTFAAIGDSLAAIVKHGDKREFAIANSEVLSNRKNVASAPGMFSPASEGFLRDAIKGGKEAYYAGREGRLRDVNREIAQAFLGPMEFLDYEMAIISWNAFKRQGEGMGLKGKDLYRYADDGVITTQASNARIDLSPIQRSALGKILTQFSNFTFTDWSFMFNEVLKPMKTQSIWKSFDDARRLVGIITSFNIAAEVLGYDPPTPQPLKAAWKSYQKGDDILTGAAKVAGEIVLPYTPIFGSIKNAQPLGGPLVGTIYESSRTFAQRPGSQNILEPISKFGGVPLASPLWRVYRGSRELTPLQRFRGVEPPSNEGGGGSLDSGLKSGLSGKMGSGLPK